MTQQVEMESGATPVVSDWQFSSSSHSMAQVKLVPRPMTTPQLTVTSH